MKTESAIPQPGETWTHRHYGSVKIIRAWNETESICEEPRGRRRILQNCFMKRPEQKQNQKP